MSVQLPNKLILFKLLKVIKENLDKEELGSTLIADRMAMSSAVQFYRKFKEISILLPVI